MLSANISRRHFLLGTPAAFQVVNYSDLDGRSVKAGLRQKHLQRAGIRVRVAGCYNTVCRDVLGALMLSSSRPRVSGTTNRTKTSVAMLSVP
jgi:hypothetical protein